MRTNYGLGQEAFAFRLISLPNPRHPAGLDGETAPAINHDLHLVHVTRGEVEFRLKDGQTATGRPDCVVAIPPYQFYTCRQRTRGELEMLNIHFQISWRNGWKFQDAWEFPLVFHPKKLQGFQKSLRRHAGIWRKADASFPHRWHSAFGVHQLVHAYAQEHARPLKRPRTDAVMLHARRMIEDSVLPPFIPSFEPGYGDPTRSAGRELLSSRLIPEYRFNPNSEVDRGDLTQFVGRECLPSELTVSKDTPRSAVSHRDSTSCASSSAPTSEFGFNAARIASEAGLSIAQFNRRFRNALGFSPKEYWQRCMLRVAMERLLEPGSSIKEVAATLGFSDQFYFSRWFHRMQGVSPSEFRSRKEVMP